MKPCLKFSFKWHVNKIMYIVVRIVIVEKKWAITFWFKKKKWFQIKSVQFFSEILYICTTLASSSSLLCFQYPNQFTINIFLCFLYQLFPLLLQHILLVAFFLNFSLPKAMPFNSSSLEKQALYLCVFDFLPGNYKSQDMFSLSSLKCSLWLQILSKQ